MPVFAVKAASMSSSAFFIEAAANTVRLLSWARAGEWTVPHRMTKAAKSPARRYMAALRAYLRRCPRAQFRRWLDMDATGRKRRSANPDHLRSVGISLVKTITGWEFG